MDPNTALKRIRKLIDELDNDTDSAIEELCTLVDGLDQWLIRGGVRPRAWQTKTDRNREWIDQLKPTHYDRLDIVEAHYWWNADHHMSQTSDSYIRLCRIGRYFKPSPLHSSPTTKNACDIYDNLCNQDNCDHRGDEP